VRKLLKKKREEEAATNAAMLGFFATVDALTNRYITRLEKLPQEVCYTIALIAIMLWDGPRFQSFVFECLHA